jgi:biopolymer transport protein ExbD
MGKTTVALVLLSISVLFASCASPSAVNVYVDKKGYCRVNGKLVKERSVPAALAKSGVSSSTPINIRGDSLTQKAEVKRMLWIMTRSKYHTIRILDTRHGGKTGK